MEPKRSRITSKGQLTVPKAVRDRLGVREGDELEFVEEGGRVVIRKPPRDSVFTAWMGYLRDKAGCDPDDLVRDMRGE